MFCKLLFWTSFLHIPHLNHLLQIVKNNFERPRDALAVKNINYWLTTWNQEMLAHPKIIVSFATHHIFISYIQIPFVISINVKSFSLSLSLYLYYLCSLFYILKTASSVKVQWVWKTWKNAMLMRNPTLLYYYFKPCHWYLLYRLFTYLYNNFAMLANLNAKHALECYC